jgi:hypothetical protein
MRETTMTTLRVEHGALSEAALDELSTTIRDIFGKVFHR